MDSMIKVGNVVTLEDDLEFLLLEETEYEGKKYFYAIKTINQEQVTDDTMIFEAIVENGEEFLMPVAEKELFDKLLEIFKDIVADKLADIEFPDEAI